MYRVGVDVGGSSIVAGLVVQGGQLVYKKSITTVVRPLSDGIVDDIAGLINDILNERNVSKNEVQYIGVGSPGTCNPCTGHVLYAKNLNFENVALCEKLSSKLHLPVYLENDANCAALGEAKMGAGADFSHSITVTFGTGIGGGIIVDGRIYHGPFFGAGEVGHHIIYVDGQPCTCGKNGCWEAYASATALIRDSGQINAKAAFDAAIAGNDRAIKIIDRYYQYAAIGIANLIDILQPQIIILGGGVAAQGESFLQEVTKRTAQLVFAGDMRTTLALAKLGNDAGIIGAAFLGESLPTII